MHLIAFLHIERRVGAAVAAVAFGVGLTPNDGLCQARPFGATRRVDATESAASVGVSAEVVNALDTDKPASRDFEAKDFRIRYQHRERTVYLHRGTRRISLVWPDGF